MAKPKNFEAIADYLQTELFPNEHLQSQQILLALYRQIAQGAPVGIGALADTVGLPKNSIQETLSTIDASRLQYDEAGCIIGFAGLSQMPTRHLLVFEGRQLYTWCVWDALFLPALLGKPANLQTICPVSGQQISLLVTLDGVKNLQPETAMMSFVTPGRKNLCGNLRDAFCNHVNFFATVEIADSWQQDNPHASIFSLDIAFELGTIRNEAGFGLALRKEIKEI